MIKAIMWYYGVSEDEANYLFSVELDRLMLNHIYSKYCEIHNNY